MSVEVLPRIVKATTAVRAALLAEITGAGTELGLIRQEVGEAFTRARVATETLDTLAEQVRRRTPFGRKARLPLDSEADNERQWLMQQAADADRGAWPRPEVPAKFTACVQAADAARDAWQQYERSRTEWNQLVNELTAATMAAGAPWHAEPRPAGLTVLADAKGRPRGCAIDGQPYIAAQALPEPRVTEARARVATMSAYFTETWQPPAPEPEPAPPPDPSPFDRPATTATASPAVLLAQARGAAVVR